MSKFIKQIMYFLFSRVAVRFATLLSFVIVARILSPRGLGIYAVFTSTVYVASFMGNLGLRQASAQRLGRAPELLDKITGALLICTPLLSVISGVIAWLAMTALPASDAYQIISATIICIFGALLLMNSQGLYLARGQVTAFNISEIAQRTSFLIAILPALFIRPSHWTVIWIYSLSSLVVGMVCFAHAAALQRPALDIRLCASLIRQGVPYALALAMIMLNSRVGVLITSNYSTSSSGAYFAALRIFDASQEIPSAAGLILFSRLVQTSDHSKEAKRIFLSAAHVFAISFFICIVMLPFREEIGKLILGRTDPEFSSALQILLFSLPFASVGKILYPAIAGAGRPMLGAFIYSLALGGNLIVCAMFVPQVGTIGAALGLLLSHILASTLLFVVAIHHFSVIKRLELRRRSRKSRT